MKTEGLKKIGNRCFLLGERKIQNGDSPVVAVGRQMPVVGP